MPMGHHSLNTKWPLDRLDVHCLNEMVYFYYNLKLWVKQIDKAPDANAILLDLIDTTGLWRVESERPIMDEALEWLEHDVDVLKEEKEEP